MKTNNHYLIQKVVIYFCEKLVKLNLLFTFILDEMKLN